MITDKELDAMQARCDAATEGPWEYGHVGYGGNEDGPWRVVLGDGSDLIFHPGAGYGGVERAQDGEFISRARTDIPRLIEEVRRLREGLEKIAEGPDLSLFDTSEPQDARAVALIMFYPGFARATLEERDRIAGLARATRTRG